MSYEKLFTPGSIGNLELKNRIVMPAMGCSLAESTGEAGTRMIKYYADRARGGAGLIITEITRVDDETGVGTPNQLSVTNTHMIAQLSRLAEAVHAYDTKIFVQLHHPGNQTPSRLIDGRQPVSASDVTCNVIGEQPRALTTEEVEAMVRKFVTGAVIAQKAGIDGVEIHAAHGYLVSQFLSPHTNKRTDKYGGSFEGRMRFVTEIIMGIKAYCGPKFPISVRMNGSDYLPDGITEEDGIAQAKYLEALGISCINVSCGTYDSGATIIEPSYFKEGWKINLAANIRKAVKIPVIAVCNVKHPAFAEQMLADGAVDFVGIVKSSGLKVSGLRCAVQNHDATDAGGIRESVLPEQFVVHLRFPAKGLDLMLLSFGNVVNVHGVVGAECIFNGFDFDRLQIGGVADTVNLVIDLITGVELNRSSCELIEGDSSQLTAKALRTSAFILLFWTNSVPWRRMPA